MEESRCVTIRKSGAIRSRQKLKGNNLKRERDKESEANDWGNTQYMLTDSR